MSKLQPVEVAPDPGDLAARCAAYEQEVELLRAALAEERAKRGQEDAVHASEYRYRRLFESAIDAIFISERGGRFVEVNARACELTGFSREELMQLGPPDLVTPASRAQNPLRWEEIGPGEVHRREREVQCKDGSAIPVEVYFGLVEDNLVHAVVRDRRERQRVQAEQARLKAFYENVLNKLPLQVAVLDRDGHYLYLNPAAVADPERRAWMIGRTTEEYGRAFYQDPTPFVERYEWLREVARGTSLQEHEESFTNRTGEVRHFIRIAAPIAGPDGDTQVLAFGIDLTERKRFEQQLIEAKESAEEMDRLKTAFLANMSHEIRTPLTSVIGFSTLLVDLIQGEERELAALIARGGKRLLDTLNSVLELSMLEAGNFKADPYGIDVVQVARECVELCQPLAAEKNLSIKLLAEAPVKCVLDEASLSRVLHNLVGNAIKFTSEGGVTVEVETAPATVIVRVCDTGIGIDAGFLPHLFDAFKQESTGWKRTYEGAGLGLAITHRLVALLGGTIGVESEKGGGTVITVAFPRA